ncbi:hypothetical protein TBLA_0D02690 [Henningerozyma blattae CBS 6284]|uniref:Integrase catalytic domain-containing protein n=1 Tax=Henningerozyma blattae (strain ATCC 34711 / CBS 6284 / DSM 70876 / NBRC 10599 / NRRL Y-10934 / UCD 77-7) TaxID=1071380 RepID=I2H320_HENB6|nr:hypothetical protein TBLA_0D02690 [Tetrapisispora blattae CBS 6284]CCH60772.1 hypothetical protein TBLA_0D02690 [Tetrapisispora blattae CBS 6284]
MYYKFINKNGIRVKFYYDMPSTKLEIQLNEMVHFPKWMVDLNKCEICVAGKMTKHFHYTNSMNNYTMLKTPGSSWTINLFGPVNKVTSGTPRFMMLMVDSVSRYVICTTHLYKIDDEIVAQIDNNIRFIETQFGRKVQEFITDRGSEFTNNDLKLLEDKKGIQLLSSISVQRRIIT